MEIQGDLGSIVCGTTNAKVGLESLKVESLGVQTTTQAGTATYTSTITGSLGSFEADTVMGAYLNVVSGSGTRVKAVGKIGSVTIHDLLTARDPATTATTDGLIQAATSIGSITVGYAADGTASAGTAIVLQGGTGSDSGTIIAGSTMGKVKVAGRIVGGAGADSGAITSGADFSSFSLTGSLEGGAGQSSGTIRTAGAFLDVSMKVSSDVGNVMLGGAGDGSGLISSTGDMDSVKITGNIQGATPHSGGVDAGGTISKLTLTGSLLGGSTTASTARSVPFSGYISAGDKLSSVTITGDVEGGMLAHSGVITADGKINSVIISGHLQGNAQESGLVQSGSAGTGGRAVWKSTTGLLVEPATDLVWWFPVGQSIRQRSPLQPALVLP